MRLQVSSLLRRGSLLIKTKVSHSREVLKLLVVPVELLFCDGSEIGELHFLNELDRALYLYKAVAVLRQHVLLGLEGGDEATKRKQHECQAV